jgi:hypothetical protein
MLVHDHGRIAGLLLREEGEGEDVLVVIVEDVLARRVSVDRSAGLSAKSRWPMRRRRMDIPSFNNPQPMYTSGPRAAQQTMKDA